MIAHGENAPGEFLRREVLDDQSGFFGGFADGGAVLVFVYNRLADHEHLQ